MHTLKRTETMILLALYIKVVFYRGTTYIENMSACLDCVTLKVLVVIVKLFHQIKVPKYSKFL